MYQNQNLSFKARTNSIANRVGQNATEPEMS